MYYLSFQQRQYTEYGWLWQGRLSARLCCTNKGLQGLFLLVKVGATCNLHRLPGITSMDYIL